MLCALTVRTLKPGAFDEFREAFMQGFAEHPPEGWVRFNMLRQADDPDQVICMGVFDGSVDELRRSSERSGYEDQLSRIAPYVESVGTDGIFEIAVELTAEAAAAR